MKCLVILLCCAVATVLGNDDSICAEAGAHCGLKCENYFDFPSLCPGEQRCCVDSHDCEDEFGGHCQDPSDSCVDGTQQEGDGYQICPEKSQVCCVPRIRTTLKPTQKPTPWPALPDGEEPQNPKECGKSFLTPGVSRIVGGANARHGSWPWQISLHGDYGKQHICGGSIINANWVITAAHCVVEVMDTEYYKVIVGEFHLDGDDGTEQIIALDQIFPHAEYDGSVASDPYDIALIKLSEPIKMDNPYVNTICLPEGEELKYDYVNETDCWATGWGLTKGPQDRNYLQESRGPVWSNYDCGQAYEDAIVDSHVCWGNGKHGVCQGDSGGPLVCRKDGQFTLVGVTSFGTGQCNLYPMPSVFTRVTYYVNWMADIMESN